MATTSTTLTSPSQRQPHSKADDFLLHLSPHLLLAPSSSSNPTPSDPQRADKLLELLPSGEPVFQPPLSAAEKLTKDLRRLWERGDYADISIESLKREEEEERARAARGEAGAGEGEESGSDGEAESDQDEEGEGIRPEELMRLKQEVLMRLQQAMQQTLTSQTLLALLQASAPSSSSAPKPPPQHHSQPPQPQIPLDGLPQMTATLTTPHPPSTSTQLKRLQLVAGLKNRSLRHAAHIFDRAASDIERSLEAESRYFSRALSLREGWRLAPRVERGFGPGGRRRAAGAGGAGKEARDFEVYYGMEGAPLPSRARAVAHLSPTGGGGGGGGAGELLFPTRTGRRLRLTLRAVQPSPLAHLAGSSLLEPPNLPGRDAGDAAQLDAQLREAQKEVLDREVFDRVRAEAMEMVQMEPVIRERVVALRPLPGLVLVFELVDPGDLSSSAMLSEDSAPGAAGAGGALGAEGAQGAQGVQGAQGAQGKEQVSPAIQLLASLLPLLHLPRTRPSLLTPLIKLFQYTQFTSLLLSSLSSLSLGLSSSGLALSIRKRLVSDDAPSVWRALLGEDPWALGGEVRLALEGCAPIYLSVEYPCTLLLQTPRTGLVVTSEKELRKFLSGLIADQLAQQFRRVGGRVLGESGAGRAGGAEWVVQSGGRGWGEWASGAVGFQIKIGDGQGQGEGQGKGKGEGKEGGDGNGKGEGDGKGKGEGWQVRVEAVWSKRASGREGASPGTPGMGRVESLRKAWPPEEGEEGKGGLVDWFERGMRWVVTEEE